MAEDPDKMDEAVARYITEHAAELKRICDAMEWQGISDALTMAIAEAQRIAANEADTRKNKH